MIPVIESVCRLLIFHSEVAKSLAANPAVETQQIMTCNELTTAEIFSRASVRWERSLVTDLRLVTPRVLVCVRLRGAHTHTHTHAYQIQHILDTCKRAETTGLGRSY